MNVVKVKSGDSFAIINESDYDPNTHELFEGEKVGKRSSVQDRADQIEVERQLQANRGVVRSSGAVAEDRNASGTFSTPTPTDIRYPDKNQTEFENNHGAFIGKDAPALRAENDLPDAPGGINPDAEMKRRRTGKGADDRGEVKPASPQATEHQPDVAEASKADGESHASAGDEGKRRRTP